MPSKNSRPHRSKPYELKMAERTAAKRAMRSGNREWVRPQEPRAAQNSRTDQPSEHAPD